MAGLNDICVSAIPADTEPASTVAVVRPALVASLLSASVASFLCCHWPVSPDLAPAPLFSRAFIYVSTATLAGAAGAWFYWNPAKVSSAVSLRDFILRCSAGWAWTPAIALLLQQGSSWAAPLAALSAVPLAEGLRYSACAASSRQLAFQQSREKELFAKSIQPIPGDWHASVISICIYVAFFALHLQAFLIACTAAGVASFLFTWQLSSARQSGKARELQRSAATLLVATLITTLSLWVGVRGQGSGPASGIANLRGHGSGDAPSRNIEKRPIEGHAVGASGYSSIILWPLPPKREIMAPLPARSALQGIQFRKPLAIQFDGAYWYFQPPETKPDVRAHVAQGDPLEVNIHSTDFTPLVMEAHQDIAPAVRISRCREIQVEIESRDNRPGDISVEMLLTDSIATGKPTLHLGRQRIISSEPNHFRIKLSPVEETLRFPIPSQSAIHKFDQITFVVTSDSARLETGAKIAIRQLLFLAR